MNLEVSDALGRHLIQGRLKVRRIQYVLYVPSSHVLCTVYFNSTTTCTCDDTSYQTLQSMYSYLVHT